MTQDDFYQTHLYILNNDEKEEKIIILNVLNMYICNVKILLTYLMLRFLNCLFKIKIAIKNNHELQTFKINILMSTLFIR